MRRLTCSFSVLSLSCLVVACGGSSGDTGTGVDTLTTSGSDTTSDATMPTETGATSTGETGGTTSTVGTTDAPTSEPPEMTGSSGEGTTTTGVEPATTTTGESTGSTTGESTGETTGGSTGESTGDESTGGGDGDYAAFYVAGGLDRIFVRKRNLADDRCTTLVFVWPSNQDPPGFAVGLPAEWGVQEGMIHQGAADCLQDFMFPMYPEFAETGLGDATWPAMPLCPPTLDIDISLGFPVNMPWVPDQDVLQATGVPVQGC